MAILAGANSRHRPHSKRFKIGATMADADAVCTRLARMSQSGCDINSSSVGVFVPA